jgi:biopolymer transport protein TolR
VAELDARLPSLGRSRAVGGPDVGSTLNLSVTIVGNGIIVAGEGGKLQPGCNSVTSGAVITVPRTGDSYAWPQLTQCAERLKSRFPDETRVIVSADPDIEFQQVVGAMDALRANAQNDELFSEVMLSAGPRGN